MSDERVMPEETEETVLRVRDLSVQFDSVDGTVHAVNNVSFDLKRGQTLGVVGESGSGKSVSMMSLLRLIAEPPGKITSGSAVFHPHEGKPTDLLALSRRQMTRLRGDRVGFIFQDPMSSLNPLMTVGNQITESVKKHTDLRGRAARERTISLLEHVGIPGARERYGNYPHQFSGGMRQRVMIAIAISCNPDILIADEPTTALDVTVQAQIADVMKKLSKELSISVIWISHDLGVVAGLADQLMVMYGGTVVEYGEIDRVYAHPRHPYTIGLLGALPKLGASQERLVNIGGAPPSLFSPPTQCPFAARCPWAFDRCTQARPPLYSGAALNGSTAGLEHADAWSNSHLTACFYDLEHGRPRAADEAPLVEPAESARDTVTSDGRSDA
ncbi:MAG: ABC transporter ATP-binding protein [Spirochaetota bacterium]